MSQYTWTNPGVYGRAWGVTHLTHVSRLVPLTTWNPNDKNANITLSNGNLTATDAGAGNRTVRATASFTTGKWYWEVVATVKIGSQDNTWGLANATQSLTSFLGGVGSNSVGWNSDGTVFLNNSSSAGYPTFAQGTTLGIAWDAGAQKIWFTANGASWNLGGAADPATGVGGFDISTISGALFPAWTGGASTSAGTANFGASTYGYAATMPNGYYGFDGQVGTAFVSTTQPIAIDWPNPRGYTPGVSLRTHIDATRIQLIGQDQFFGLAGHPNFDWPNPRGYVPGVSLRTHIDGARVTLFGQDTIYGAPGQGVPNYDWPNPRGYVPAIALRTHIDPTKLPLVTAPPQIPPFLPADPVPRGYAHPVALRTHLDGARIILIGQDKFFGAPGQGPCYDYPNPRGYIPAISLRTHLDPLKLTLRGQDRIYGAPGQGVPNYDWPVPKGPAYGISLRSWSQNLLQSTIAPIPTKPNSQTDYPNPRGYAYPISLRTHINPRIQVAPTQWATVPDAAGVWTTPGGAAGIWTTQPDAI